MEHSIYMFPGIEMILDGKNTPISENTQGKVWRGGGGGGGALLNAPFFQFQGADVGWKVCRSLFREYC